GARPTGDRDGHEPRAQAQPNDRPFDLRFPTRDPLAALPRYVRPRGARGAAHLCDEVSAVDRPGDGQGYGGYGLLYLQPADLAQRSRWRATALRHQHGSVPSPEPGASARLAG